MTLIGPERPPRSGSAPKQLVVILHGWGADGANLIDLADRFARDLPDAQFYAPNAPSVCDVNPYGYQWFPLNDRRPAALESGVRAATNTLNHFLDEKQAALQLDNARTALVGFSQGTMLALHTGLRRAPAIAGIVGFSGALLAPEALAQEAAIRLPICLLHGQMDDVVPYSAMTHATSTLREHGFTLETHSRPLLGHSIDMEGLEKAAAFLKRILA